MPTNQPNISVVIPAYNAEPFIGRAIESVLAQTRPAAEIIIVDDGSNDATGDVVESFGARALLVRQENAGPSAARNHGTRLAQGEWIAFLDADDAWLPEKLEKQLPYLGEDGIGAVHSPTDTCLSDCDYEGELTFERLWQQNPIGTSSVVLRKAAWMDVRGFDEDRELTCVEDYNLWLRLLAAGWRILRCPERLVAYTPCENSLSSQTHRVVRAELLNARRVAAAAGLEKPVLRRKQRQIHGEYGQSLVHSRELRDARRHLTQALLRGPQAVHAKYWLATLVPPALLDWRRALRLRAQTEDASRTPQAESTGTSHLN